MPSAEVGESSKTPLQFCTDLQSLIFITLNYVLNPLRRELRKSHEYSDILNLEIQDGENKTFEYIAQQISEICNAEEDVADSILVQYPSSLSCFRCLGIDEDTIHGLLYIREITFLKLLDMQENEVRDLLSVYCVPLEDIDRILMGLSKIRCNIDLLESDQPFEDDTRNLIKQVIKLTEKSEPSPGFEKPDGAVLLHCDPLSSPPLYVTGPQEFGENCMSPSNNLSNGMVSSQRLLRSGRFSSDHGIQIDHLIDRTSPPIPSVRSGSESHPSSCFSINPPNLQFSFNHPPYPLDLSTQTLNRNSRRSKTPVPFHRFCRALSPVSHRANSSNLAKSNILDGVLSVPSTPAPRVFGTPIHQKSPAKGAVMSTSYTSATDSTPPHSPCSFYPGFFQKGSTNRDKAIKMPATPPSKHKIKFTFPLHRSKSHESNLASKIYLPSSNGAGKTSHTTSKNPGRVANVFHTPDSHSPAANDSNVFCFSTPTHIANAPPSPKFNSRPEHHPSVISQSGRLAVPGSLNGSAHLPIPGHTHRFESEAKFTDFVRGTPCAVCNGRLTLRFPHCVYCNMKTHKNCVTIASKMPCFGPSRAGDQSDPQRLRVSGPLLGPNLALGSDCSNSASSCNSCSTPGSPFQVDSTGVGKQLQPNGATFGLPPTPPNQFDEVNGNTACAPANGHVDSYKRPSLPIPPASSCNSSQTVVDNRLSRLESVESQDDHPAFNRTSSMSVTLREWNIPIQSLQLGELIGRGTFGSVYRGKWHGEVAVKMIDFNDRDDSSAFSLDSFKREVVALHKLRHENLVLFMGACTKPPDLAIVTQLSKGETLHSLLHIRKHALSANWIISIASQVAKGMGYLHARQIVHRDLKTRNIFIETNYKAVIADFALFNFVNFCKLAKSGHYVHVPANWLCYVAPEIIRALNIGNADHSPASDLPFTPETDVFAFGTVWYELLSREYPFRGLPTETLVYLVGTGIKPTLKLQCPREFKELMRQCWSYRPHERPEFTALVKQLDRLPKLHRSPSYPSKPHSAFVVGHISGNALLV